MVEHSLPDLSTSLSRFVAEATVDEAARSRARERSLRDQAGDEASFTGVLLDLAERGRPVVISTGGDRRHRGALVTVAADFCIIATERGNDLLVSYRGLGSVRPLPLDAVSSGHRVARLTMSLRDALTHLCDDRPRLRVGLLTDADPLIGELRSVGRDVLTLRLDGRPAPTSYVPVAQVAELAFAD